MKITKAAAPVALALLLALGLTGCKNVKEEDVLAKAALQLPAIESYISSSRFDLSMGYEDIVSNTSGESIFKISLDPFFSEMELTTTSDGFTDMTNMYIIEEGDIYSTYMLYEDTWVKTELDREYFDYILSPYEYKKNIEYLISEVTDFRLTGSEDIAERTTYRLTGSIAPEKLYEASNYLGLFEYIGLGGMGEEYFVNLKPVRVHVWFDCNSYMPVKYEVTLSDAIQTVFDNAYSSYQNEGGDDSAPGQYIEIDTYVVAFEATDINIYEPEPLPQEVSSAVSFNDYYTSLYLDSFSE
ncbi:MAG: hypothetical protein IJC39_03545 [Firmicutes bacterium]|nr:hypothetical protein [Bacillota bacterium]